MELQFESQTKQVYDHLKSGRTITPLEALQKYGIFRLGARVYDLKEQGVPVKTTMKQSGRKRFAEYSITL